MKCDVCNTEYKPAAGSNVGTDSGGGATPVGSVQPFPTSSTTNNGTRFNATGLAQGVYYAFGGSGKAGAKKLSFAIGSGGFPCYQTFDLNVPSPAHTGGTPWIDAPADGSDWTYYVMFTAGNGVVQDGHIDMLDA